MDHLRIYQKQKQKNGNKKVQEGITIIKKVNLIKKIILIGAVIAFILSILFFVIRNRLPKQEHKKQQNHEMNYTPQKTVLT